ncbi:MAG: hypothetical protein KKH52_01315 [Nanoarchaeota archaeon]|nr:hypothetical protein [Nanoarchaeota archaeon]MBU1623211.1 hypothetical protein [Nanoarchaeota archaeon]MBU1974016.1 hypothetical protein [Nanoarchaeota archaeon]
MGWLFGKKKVPKVPLPPGRLVDKDSLNFPNKVPSEKVIGPEHFKSAVGVDKPLPHLKSEAQKKVSKPIKKPKLPVMRHVGGPLFVKVDVYQQILGELDGLKHDLTELGHANKNLEKSEFNEEEKFKHLQNTIKVVHDRLMESDKIIFKG